MNTNQTTAHDDTAEHGQAECRCPDDRCAGPDLHHDVGEPCPCTRTLDAEVEQLIASVKVIDGGEKAAQWETIPFEDEAAIICRFAVLSEDCSELTIYRTPALEVLDKTYVTPETASATHEAWMVRSAIERYVYGRLGQERTFYSIDKPGRLTAELNAEITHPSWCADREDCWPKTLKSNVEHISTIERAEGNEFIAAASLESIVGTVDYRDSPDTLSVVNVEIDGRDKGVVALSLFPDDLRTLGNFLIAQADRFASMMREVGVAA